MNGKAMRGWMLCLVLGAWAVGAWGAAEPEASGKWLQPESLQAVRAAGGLEVRCTVNSPLNHETSRQLELSLTDLDGNVIATKSKSVAIAPGANACALLLSSDKGLQPLVDEAKIPLYVLRYKLSGPRGTEQGARSLVHALAQLETRVIAYRDLVAGSKAALRLVATNHATSAPVQGAKVVIQLSSGGEVRQIFAGVTGADGCLDAQFPVPENVEGDAKLLTDVTAEGLGTDSLAQPVMVKRETKILLTTDKPLYQPGQTIHMRALSLRAGDLRPEAKQELTFEVMDSKGNKVFKRKVDTGEFGVASAAFELATEVNLGGYTVRALLGTAKSEKKVTIDKYVLPKFKIEAKTERAYYLPGETLKADIQADYFFGKPVAGGKVHVTASKFEVKFEKFAETDGVLDPNGHWTFEMPLPAHFVGTPIEQGKASARLEIEVTDTADHREDKVVMTPVADAALSIAAVPESGALVPGIANQVYILVSYPDGTPAAGAGVIAEIPEENNVKFEVETDKLGIAAISITPNQKQGLKMTVRAHDKQGHNVEKPFTLSVKPGAEGLILRTDKALYQVGETINAEVFTGKPKGAVYFDVIRQGQTVFTRSAELSAGRASIAIDADAGMSGSIALQAYVFTPTTDLIRDTRLLYVNPADALNVGIQLDKDTHKPGEHADLKFQISDRQGAPTAAAIGVTIVDEAVFALQETHPGLEKIYFTLEQEIMKPRYEIHGYELPKLVTAPVPEAAPGTPRPVLWSDEQQQAARVLLASAPQIPDPPIRLNSFEGKVQQADDAIAERYQRDLDRVYRAVIQIVEKNEGKMDDEILKVLVRQKYLRFGDLIDPWGNPYEIDVAMAGPSLRLTVLSYGPDGIKGTPDDISPETDWARQYWRRGGRKLTGAVQVVFDERSKKMRPVPLPPPPVPTMAAKREAPSETTYEYDVNGDSGQRPVRVREYFPETLLFEPALITDANGAATLGVDFADSITTWRMSAMASSRGGALGSKDTPLRVFQEFFVDIDLPVALTQHDRVSIPVVVYGYLDAAQDVRLKLEVEPWFKLDGGGETTVQLAPNEVRSLYFPIEVVGLGKHKLTVYAYGSTMSDAIRREIEVLPDGEEKNIAFSDRLSGKVEQSIAIPPDAISGASKILVRVYPGVFSQIVDGLASMLQMPFGCFEQTSSITYPNILIVQYLKATQQINPEVQMKAEGFINAGYQRLLSYEVKGGGFSWFGDAPANKVLTAWGVKEFADMSQVHEVDPEVIKRTQAWLLKEQQPDGSWKPDERYTHAEVWKGIQDSTALVTAYVLDAILCSGGKGDSVQEAVEYLKAKWPDGAEAYTTALVANALVLWNKDDPFTKQVLAKLYDLRQEDKDVVYWKGGSSTVTFSHGDAADVETTALAAIAFLKAGAYPQPTTQALTYLVRKKTAQGHWGSTQATILSLKALMEALGNRAEKANAKIAVTLNGETASELAITPEDSDVMRLVDLGEKTKAGANTVALSLTGEGSMLYQIVGKYYAPWSQRKAPEEPMTIEVVYDKTQLAVNDLVKASVKVVNLRPAAAQMTVVDLGIPPGFQVVTPDLDALVKKGVMQKYEMTGRQIITYFEKIDANATVEFAYSLRAKYPLRAQTPQSRVYEYYNPEVSGTATPQPLVVQ